MPSNSSACCLTQNHFFQFYEFVLYDYAKVQRTMLDQASLYNQINTQERFYPSYYRVVFYGEGFDDSIKSQEFVYVFLFTIRIITIM